MIASGGRPCLIIDTKWKSLASAASDPQLGVSQADVYQMIAYAQVYACDRIMLLYPRDLPTEPGLQFRHRMVGASDRKLSVATVSLTDLSTVPDQPARVVAEAAGAL